MKNKTFFYKKTCFPVLLMSAWRCSSPWTAGPPDPQIHVGLHTSFTGVIWLEPWRVQMNCTQQITSLIVCTATVFHHSPAPVNLLSTLLTSHTKWHALLGAQIPFEKCGEWNGFRSSWLDLVCLVAPGGTRPQTTCLHPALSTLMLPPPSSSSCTCIPVLSSETAVWHDNAEV